MGLDRDVRPFGCASLPPPCFLLSRTVPIWRHDGYTPLNFISGGSIRDDRGEVLPNRTHSERSARSDVFLVGANLAF